MESLIELIDVTVRIGDAEILSHVNLKVPLGKTSFLLGPAGSGKSTLIKVMAGLVPVSEGKVLINGGNYQDMSNQEMEQFRSYAGFVFQDSALWGNQNILNNMILPIRYHAPHINLNLITQKAKNLLKKVGFSDELTARPAELSHGEQKLVGLARSLMTDPMIVFMDSPLSLVDTSSIRRIVAFLMELKAAHRTLILVNDRVEFTCEAADYVYILNEGRLAQWGSLEELVPQWPDYLEPFNNAALTHLRKRNLVMESLHEV